MCELANLTVNVTKMLIIITTTSDMIVCIFRNNHVSGLLWFSLPWLSTQPKFCEVYCPNFELLCVYEVCVFPPYSKTNRIQLTAVRETGLLRFHWGGRGQNPSDHHSSIVLGVSEHRFAEGKVIDEGLIMQNNVNFPKKYPANPSLNKRFLISVICYRIEFIWRFQKIYTNPG